MHTHNSAVKGPFSPKITVIGVGGAGGNAVNNMIASKLGGVTFLTVNTDAQALENALSENVIQLGSDSTGGLGAGARPEIGRAAAEESMDEVMEKLNDQNMVFITAGMGGGTGTGAAPVIAQACKEKGILTVGVVTKPFQFEGQQRMRLAEAGIDEMAQYVDTLIVIPNQNLFRIANEKTTFADAFRLADEVLQSGVRGVTDLMVVPGMINLDFADVRSATSEMGKAMMGTGEATGDRRAIEAAEQAINNPLLDDVSMKGARSVIINISGGQDLTLFEIEEACNRINDEVDPDATIIFGSTYDDNLEGTMRVTVVATGIEAEINRRAATRPVRPMGATAQQPRTVEANNVNADIQSDSFATRYPQPSRVNTSTSSAAPQQQTQQAPQTIDVPYVTEQQAVASSNFNAGEDRSTVTEDIQQQPEIGSLETEYVTEGSAVRKVEVKPEQVETTNYNNSVIPPHGPSQNEVRQESSLVLNPPMRRESAQQDSRKTPSLFERITGRNRNEAKDEGAGITSSTTSGRVESMPSGLTVDRKTVASAYDTPTAGKAEQGMLNIDAPKIETRTKSVSSDDLDIPAFLRRQIS